MKLSRCYPDHVVCGAVLEDLRRMRPQFEGALAALTEIERRRGLTYKELARQRAFRMLLEGAKAE